MSEVVYDTKYLQLKKVSAGQGDWYYAHRPNAIDVVVILPKTKDEVLFLLEERPPIQAEGRGKYTIGLPAGLVGDERKGETVEDAIRAELIEEAGLEAEKIKINYKKVAGSSGCISETCVIATAYIKDKTIVKQPVDDGGIIVDRIWVKKKDITEWLSQKNNEGYVVSAHTLGALFYLFTEENI